jgi:hypothetical protein
MAAGYSGTPLAAKLGIVQGSEVLLVGAPRGYRALLAPLPAAVRFVHQASPSTTLVQIFETRKSPLAAALAGFREALQPTATVWVSWPKKAARIPSEITEDTVRELALPLGFVDVKVCAVDATWSGLKLVVRKELR